MGLHAYDGISSCGLFRVIVCVLCMYCVCLCLRLYVVIAKASN